MQSSKQKQARADDAVNDDFPRSTRRVLGFQVVLAALLMLALVAWYFLFEAVRTAEPGYTSLGLMLKSAAFGSMLGCGNTLLSARSVKRSSEAVLAAPNFAMMPVYAGLVNKLILVGGGIALGLIGFGLAPVFVVLGYLVGHVAFAIASFTRLKSSSPSVSSD